MSQLAISEVARTVGLRPSAIRYYEQIGVLPSAPRTNGQRRYDTTALYRLSVIKRARETGFTLHEIRELFFGFAGNTRASTRWQKLSERKLLELEAVIDRTKAMQSLLIRLQDRCRCDTLDECGKRLLKQGNTSVGVNSLSTGHPRRRRSIRSKISAPESRKNTTIKRRIGPTDQFLRK
jgi:MerR family transcriptional regulator, redox-sensitive transcriptional activator SoxR